MCRTWDNVCFPETVRSEWSHWLNEKTEKREFVFKGESRRNQWKDYTVKKAQK